MAAIGTFMFDFIRNHRRWMQFILMLLILPSFGFVGVQGYTSFTEKEPELAVMGDQSITRQEFDWALRNQLEQYRNMLGSRFDAAALDTPELRQALLNQLINQRVVAMAATDGRLLVSDEALRRAIAARPELQEDGKFSPERYREVLASRGMSPVMFEASLRNDMILSRVLEPVATSSYLPLNVAQKLESALTEKRTVRTRTFAAADYRSQVQISDADIKAWYDANQQSLEIPTHVRADYVVLDEAAATKNIAALKEDDVVAYYEQNKNRFGQPERRRISHILINGTDSVARAQAEEIAEKAKANPDSFAELAKASSQDSGTAAKGGDLGWMTAGAMVESIETAAKALQQGEVSGVVQSDFGFHVLRLTEYQPESVKPLAEVRTEIEAEIRKQLAAEQFADMAGKLTNLVYEQRDSLQPVVDTLGLTIRHADGIARSALLDADQVAADAASASDDAERLSDPRVREALFSAEVQRDHLNSGVIQLDPGTMIVVRVAEVTPAKVPELAAVSDKIRERLIDERAMQAAQEAGEAFLKSAQANPTGDDALAGLSEPQTISRRSPGSLQQTVLAAALREQAATLPAMVGAKSGQDYVAVRIEQVEAGNADDLKDLAGLRDELSAALGGAEEAAALQMMRQSYSAEITPDARAVIEGSQSDDAS